MNNNNNAVYVMRFGMRDYTKHLNNIAKHSNDPRKWETANKWNKRHAVATAK